MTVSIRQMWEAYRAWKQPVQDDHRQFEAWPILTLCTQRAQYPLNRESSLNHNMKPLMI